MSVSGNTVSWHFQVTVNMDDIRIVCGSLPAGVPLATESLVQLNPVDMTSGTCNPAGDSTYTYTVSGTASGPYPGTFTETGTVTIGAQTEEFAPGQFRGRTTAYSATFDITSAAGNVHGSKTLDSASLGFKFGACNVHDAQVYAPFTYASSVGAGHGSGGALNISPPPHTGTYSSPNYHMNFTD